jgi:GT2 family glycosyltransferase
MNIKENFLVIAHSLRTDHVPHWLHPATMEAMHKPCLYANIYESHIFDIGNSRTQLVKMALKFPETTHILFVDDDIIIPDPKSLDKMFNFLEINNQYIVSGLYYNKNPPNWPIIFDLTTRNGKMVFQVPYYGKEPPKDIVREVSAVPLGFCLIKREVFESIKEPWFIFNDPELDSKFTHNEGDPIIIGEDIYLSVKAKDAGYRMWVDCRIDLLHYVPHFVGRPELVSSYKGKGLVRSQNDNYQRVRKELDELKAQHVRTNTVSKT